MPPSINGNRDEALQLKKEDVSEGGNWSAPLVSTNTFLTVCIAIILLYEVIERARTALDLSAFSQTLFDVYEEVLREHGIEVEDDNVPLQIITRLAGDAREHEGLVQRFKRVMGDIGVDLEYDEEGEGFEFTSQLDGISTAAQAPTTPAPLRRGSLDSLLDGSADKVAGTTDVGRQLPLRSRKSSEATAHSDIGSWWHKRRSRSATDLDSPARPQFRLSRQNGSSSIARQSDPLPSRRTGHEQGRGMQRDGITGTAQSGDSDLDDSEHTGESADFDHSNVYIPGVNAPIPDEHQEFNHHYEPEPFRPSDTRLMDDAENFEQQCLHSLLRSCMRRWRERAQEQMERNEQMMAAAVRYDSRIQFRNVKEELLREAQNRRSLRETDDFFIRLEDRAARARSLFLLTKAFTHWAKSAEDEVQRTSVARRHILRTRFFNGWRDITAVNEMKVQHFVLGTFLHKWRRRTTEVRQRQEQAIQLYDDNLQRKYYKDWFFKFCEIAAPAWRNARLDPRLKRATFQQWHEAAAIWSERDAWATDRRDQLIQRKSIRIWRQKTATVRALGPQAEEFRRRSLSTNALATIQRQARFAPLLSAFQVAGDAQRLQMTFQTWRHTAELSRRSKNVERLRVLRNAWTAWNDRLRIRALEERINDRVLIENMYKWTLASRVSLFQRVHDRTLKENCFSTWTTKRNQRIEMRNDRQNRLDIAEIRLDQFKRTQLLRTCLRKIEAETAEKRAEQAAMTVQYDMKLKQRIFEQLLGKHAHFQQLNRWAGDAQFYVLTTHTLKRWKDATQHARRNRRREAYAQMRRTTKLNLVKKTFGVWRVKAETIAEQHQQADAMLYTRAAQDSQTLLAHWRDRATVEQVQTAQAGQHYDIKIQARFFGVWKKRLEALDNMSSQAVDFRQIGVEVAAATYLKKLEWEGWEIGLRNKSAVALHERHFRQHVSAMIRFWNQQTLSRVAARPVSPTPASRSRHIRHNEDEDQNEVVAAFEDAEPLFDDNAGDETRRLEGWTEFDQSALDLSFSISPQDQLPQPFLPPSRARPSSSRPTPTRPQTYPIPKFTLRSALRRPTQPPIQEDTDFDNDAPDATSTPMPPHLRAGYMKTPSKRSVIQHKRSEIQTSPQKRMGAMSAPPAAGLRDVPGVRLGGVRSFGGMLKESGFVQGGGKGKGKVGFGDVSHIG
jgi:protein SFI1